MSFGVMLLKRLVRGIVSCGARNLYSSSLMPSGPGALFAGACLRRDSISDVV